MGDVISLSDRRRAQASGPPYRPQSRAARATFYFDLSLPGTYFAAERVDRYLSGVRWQPAFADTLWGGPLLRDPAARDQLVAAAGERAAALRMPLIWPEPYPPNARPIMRAAALACERGRGAEFVLSAGRLAFCGGFDLGTPEVLIEAAAAAALPLDDVLEAAGQSDRDAEMEEHAEKLRGAGVTALPAVRVGRLLFGGEERLAEALTVAESADGPRFRRA